VQRRWVNLSGGWYQTRLLSIDGNCLTIRTEPSKNPYTGEIGISPLVFERST
jgi:hypothetical protein